MQVAINACELRTGSAFRFLPAVDQNYTFIDRNGNRSNQRVVITDGGMYDNPGVSCIWPNRFALSVFMAKFADQLEHVFKM